MWMDGLLALIQLQVNKPYVARDTTAIGVYYDVHREAIETEITPEVINLIRKTFGPVRSSQLRFTFKRKLKPHNLAWSMEKHLEQKAIIYQKIKDNARSRARVRATARRRA